MQAKIQGNDGHTEFVVDVPEVRQDERWEEIYRAGDWSFDINEENKNDALIAIGSWIAWYRFLTLREE